MKNAGFVMSRKPTDAEIQELNKLLSVENPEQFWGGDSNVVFWGNDLRVGGLSGLIKQVFTDGETINYL